MPQIEHIEAIEKRFWTAADTLRANSNYASNEYFLPLTELIFLWHSFSHYLAVKDLIEACFPTWGGNKRALTKKTSPKRAPSTYNPRPSSTPSSPSPTATTGPGLSTRSWSPSRSSMNR